MVSDRIVSVPITLSDLEWRDAEGQTTAEDLRNYAPTVWPRTTKFGVITLAGVAYTQGSDTRTPHSKGIGPSYAHMVWPTPIKFGTNTIAHAWQEHIF